VDQHAASEKATYEKLLKSVVLSCPIAAYPLASLLSEAAVQAVRRSGFVVEDRAGVATVTAHGEFLGEQLGREDLEDLLEQMADWDGREPLLPARVRRIAAGRACRTAIRIGDLLSLDQMQRLVRTLDSLESPWNCPHGRPTIIRLGE
jgi:DNA mismatch repair protein PMS2